MKINLKEYTDWCKHMGNGVRVGQSFMNRLLPSVSWPELYYATDDEALKIISKSFMNGTFEIVDKEDENFTIRL